MDPLEIAATAARGFKVLQCLQCAEAIKTALVAAGHHGQVIEIQAGKGYDYILCNSYHGGKVAITENGRHFGVRVGDIMFDNLHTEGISFDEWLLDFVGPIGIRVTETIDF